MAIMSPFTCGSKRYVFDTLRTGTDFLRSHVLVLLYPYRPSLNEMVMLWMYALQDMVAFSQCVYDDDEEEKTRLDNTRERDWRGKFTREGRANAPPDEIRRNGKCPLTPVEVQNWPNLNGSTSCSGLCLWSYLWTVCVQDVFIIIAVLCYLCLICIEREIY